MTIIVGATPLWPTATGNNCYNGPIATQFSTMLTFEHNVDATKGL